MISINSLLKNVYKHKFFVATATLCFSIIITSISFSLTDKYSSQAVVRIPVIDGKDVSRSVGGLGSLSSIVGLGSDAGNDKANVILEILVSRDFVKTMIEEDESFLIDLFSIKGFDKKNLKNLYDKEIYNLEDGWVRKPSGIYNERKPGYVEAHRLFKKSFSVFKDPKTGMIVLSFTHYSPIFSKEVIDKIISHINHTYKKNELMKLNKRLSYLQKELISSDMESVKIALSNMIETALKEKTIATTSEQYALESIDNAFYPDTKSSPNRVFILIFSALFGFICSLMYIIFVKKEI